MSLSEIIPYLYVVAGFIIFGACALGGILERYAEKHNLMKRDE